MNADQRHIVQSAGRSPEVAEAAPTPSGGRLQQLTTAHPQHGFVHVPKSTQPVFLGLDVLCFWMINIQSSELIRKSITDSSAWDWTELGH